MSAGVTPEESQIQQPYHDETPVLVQNDMMPGVMMARTTSCCPPSNRAYVTVAILFFINLLNYMDRFTIAGLLEKIQEYFYIKNNNSYAGLLQTVFICSYMVLAPVFGYLGDRYQRKYLMAAGILVWSGTVFASSLLNRDSFWYFLALRGLVGIGEASYSTVAPTLIADLFTGDMRTRMLSVFYFAIPAGGGLGYIVGSEVAKAFGHWQWGMRVTPVLGGVCVLLCLLFVHEPPRGAIELGANPNAVSASNVHETTSWWNDVKYLWTVKSFVWLDLGFTCVCFVTGALAFWAPKFLLYSSRVQGLDTSESSISLTFGIITCVAGIVGVWLGAEAARIYRVRYHSADAIVCAIGLLGCAPLLYGALLLAPIHIYAAYVLVFLGELLLCMNWAPVGDMVLYIIIPTRRSTAGSIQILVSHLLGDAGSPWLVGKISDVIRGTSTSTKDHQISMEYSLLITTFICILGGFCFIMCSFYLVADRQKATQLTRANDDTTSLLNSVASRDHGHVAVASQNRFHGDESSDDDDDDDEPASEDTAPLVVPVQIENLRERSTSNGHSQQVV